MEVLLLLLLPAKPLLVCGWISCTEEKVWEDQTRWSWALGMVVQFLPSLLSSLHYQVHESLVPTHQMLLACLDKRAWFNLQMSSLCLPHVSWSFTYIWLTKEQYRDQSWNKIIFSCPERGLGLLFNSQDAHSFLWPKIVNLTPCSFLSLQTLDVNTDVDDAHSWSRLRSSAKGKMGTLIGLCM